MMTLGFKRGDRLFIRAKDEEGAAEAPVAALPREEGE